MRPMRAAMRAACVVLLLGVVAGGEAPRAALAKDGAAASAAALASPAGLLDYVAALPGLPASALQGASKTFAGYVELAGTERALFYALQMSERNPAKDPLVLWLKCALRCRDLACAALTHVPSPYAPLSPSARSGGPGCSSIGGGFLSELGPYYPNADGTLQENPWVRVARALQSAPQLTAAAGVEPHCQHALPRLASLRWFLVLQLVS